MHPTDSAGFLWHDRLIHCCVCLLRWSNMFLCGSNCDKWMLFSG